MILAAGLGTRLGPVTRDTPKALVDVAGTTALERVATRLVRAGADRLIINVHHQAARIMEYVRERAGFGVEVIFSHEADAPLETGGGLLNAAPLLRRDVPFFLHNVDVLSDADLAALYHAHRAARDSRAALATLAVSRRDTVRNLLFDGAGLCGRWNARTLERSEARTCAPDAAPFAFAGISVLSPALLERITERGAFSIFDVLFRLVASGEVVAMHDIGAAVWHEIGSPERLDEARRALAR